jgi:hypothetical protein
MIELPRMTAALPVVAVALFSLSACVSQSAYDALQTQSNCRRKINNYNRK